MATIKLYFDKRSSKKDNSYPLKLKLFHQDKARYIPLNLYFKEKEWDSKGGKVKSTYKNSGRVNSSIRKKVSSASDLILELDNEIASIDIDTLKKKVAENLFGKNEKNIVSREYLFIYTQEIIDNLIKAKRVGSARSYKCTLNSFKSYLNGNDIPLTKITHKFLSDYEANCLGRGLKINAIGVYLRTLRAIINRAIDEDMIPQNQYPFRKFSIKTEKTSKRAISKEDISKILNLKVDENSRMFHSLNYFTFMFNMRGMNFIDLAYLKKENLHKDRLEYRRIKTKKLYSIKLTPKVIEILEYYIKGRRLKPSDLLLPIMSKNILGDAVKERKQFDNRRKYFNMDLKKLAKLCEVDVNLTSYVTRHTWASLAKFSGITPAIIGESLGHSDLKTTETYLANFENSTLDDANDKVLDF